MRNLGLPGDFVREKTGWNSAQLDYQEVEYEGTRDYIASLYAQFRGGQNVLECDRTQQGAKWLLRVRIAIGESPDDEAAIGDDVRMSINKVAKDIFEPPFIGTVTEDELITIREAIQNPKPGQSPALTNPDASALYTLALAGVKSRTVYQPVLFRSRTAPAGHSWPDHTNGVGRIFSHGQLVADAALNGVLNFNLPPTDAIVTWNGLEFIYGWVKHEPWYDTAAGNRTVEYLEYEYGLWPVFLYPLA